MEGGAGPGVGRDGRWAEGEAGVMLGEVGGGEGGDEAAEVGDWDVSREGVRAVGEDDGAEARLGGGGAVDLKDEARDVVEQSAKVRERQVLRVQVGGVVDAEDLDRDCLLFFDGGLDESHAADEVERLAEGGVVVGDVVRGGRRPRSRRGTYTAKVVRWHRAEEGGRQKLL